MKNDLISRSALMNHLRENVFVDVTPALEQAVKDEPTAYDVDKVVEQLEGATFLTTNDDGETNYLSMSVVDAKEAMKIVKAGEVNE